MEKLAGKVCNYLYFIVYRYLLYVCVCMYLRERPGCCTTALCLQQYMSLKITLESKPLVGVPRRFTNIYLFIHAGEMPVVLVRVLVVNLCHRNYLFVRIFHRHAQ